MADALVSADQSDQAAEAATASPAEPAALHARLRKQIAEFRESGHVDPFGNPISRMALELTRIVDRGELQTADLDALVQHMSATAFEARAARMAAYVGTTDPAENDKRLRATIRHLAKPEGAETPIAFDRFRAAVETFHFGIVFTA